jgi:HD-GYP domain-containing protein (c-di-GMP phosphodiesterase class II)
VHHYASILLTVLPLSEQDKEAIEIAACFHDIAKMGMDAEYSEWDTKSDDTAYHEWKNHPQQGVDILAPVAFTPAILASILHHHERYDGRGFPAGLRGEEIPLGARIIRIANIYDDMLLAKAFPEAFSREAIGREFAVYGNGELDPYLLQVFIRALQTHEERLQ